MGTLVLVMLIPFVLMAASAFLLLLWESNFTKGNFINMRKFLFFNGSFSFLNETYIVLMTCCCLGTYYLRWNTPGNLVNSIFTSTLGCLLLLFPIVLTVIYSKLDTIKMILSRD